MTVVIVRESHAVAKVEASSPNDVLVRAPGPPGPQGDVGPVTQVYTYQQASAAAVWVITHNLGVFPGVTVVTSAGDEVEGDVHYDSGNQVTITFAAAFAGTAYLN